MPLGRQKELQEDVMRILAIGCVVLSALFATAAHSRGSGTGMHHSGTTTGGAFGTQPSAPGTNSAGTALSSGGASFVGGPPLGTGDPVTDREDRKAARMVSSICKGC
jgi:hypothetical protein